MVNKSYVDNDVVMIIIQYIINYVIIMVSKYHLLSRKAYIHGRKYFTTKQNCVQL